MTEQTKLLILVFLFAGVSVTFAINAIITEPVNVEQLYDDAFLKGYESGYMSGSRDCVKAVEKSTWTLGVE